MKTQKRLAASILKVGQNRIRINPEDEEAVAAMTREDVRHAIARGAIYKLPDLSTSRVRARKRRLAKKKRRHSGHGKRKGSKTSRTPKKKKWMRQVRAVRRKLREMRDSGKIDRKKYRKLYNLSRAGTIKSKAHAESYAKGESK